MPQLTLKDLKADCANCFGLCCVAPRFARSADFALDKPAGHPCPNLGADFRCGIHDGLRDKGFPGCVAFDCFGAGQRISRQTFAGRDWQAHPDDAGRMFAAFNVMRNLHELLYYLTEALSIPRARHLHAEVAKARNGLLDLVDGSPEQLLELFIAPLAAGVGDLLERVSEAARGGRSRKRDRRGADLIGATLTGTDFRGASLRGAYLIGADLTNADLRDADLLGTDLRGADLSGADLDGAIFLLQSQLDSANGSPDTTLPAARTRPGHWI